MIEKLLIQYFENDLSDSEKVRVDEWRKQSTENNKAFVDSHNVWKAIEYKKQMEKYNSTDAYKVISSRLNNNKIFTLVKSFQKIAAILLLPLMLLVAYQFIELRHDEELTSWCTVTSPAGGRVNFTLPDGTSVDLNSKSSLSYPTSFSSSYRNVKLQGEAFFEVTENKESPFLVLTDNINVKVTGTEFCVSNYLDDPYTKFVLVSGSISLFNGKDLEKIHVLKNIVPNELVTYNRNDNILESSMVDVEKYISWKDNILMFRDDSMLEVIHKLNKWFNVDIELVDKELEEYEYNGTFQDESLLQILDLLKYTAPLDYSIEPRVCIGEKMYSKMKIKITKN